jgi:hypothetical protein
MRYAGGIHLKNIITRPTFQIFSDGAFRKLGFAKGFQGVADGFSNDKYKFC